MRAMKIFILLLFITNLFVFGMSNHKASIREEKIRFYTYMYSDPDPVPNVGRIYPYFRFDGYTDRGEYKEWKMVILENDYIKVYLCPEIGGKIWGAIEKSTGKEFVYFNHVVKFRDIGMRGAWTSGGVEVNFGDIGHIPTCATPVDYALKELPDGSVSCSVGSVDLPSGTKWNLEVVLPVDSAYFKTRASWFNKTSLPVTYYHWMNAAAKADGNLEFIYPGSKTIGHKGEVENWPIINGRNVSFYYKNDFGRYKSYHVINSYSDYMGGYWHDDDFGFGHLSDYDDKPGKKIWIWGLSDQGMIWEKLLTDKDGQYVEYQSGKLFNQAETGSTYSPFKHMEFTPGDTDIMDETWFPLKQTGGMVAVSKYAVLNTVRKGDDVGLRVSALKKIDSEIVVMSDKKTILKKSIKLKPLELFSDSFKIKRDKNFSVEIGKGLLEYSSYANDLIVKRPVGEHAEFNWNSSYGLYIKALELEKQRKYSEALKTYVLSLKKERTFLPSLSRIALGYYRMMKYESSLKFATKALSINTYDPLANYVFGLANKRKEKYSYAKSGFSIAAQSVWLRNAAYTELAKIFMKENKMNSALKYARKALTFNIWNLSALEIKAIIFRKIGLKSEAAEVLNIIDDLDPTGHFVDFERYLEGSGGSLSIFNNKISNELPYESYLDLAVGYYRLGCNVEAAEVLRNAPQHPIVFLWRAFLNKKSENFYLGKSIGLSAKMVFPHRTETAEILDYFIRKDNNWKLKYYLGLILWNKGDKDKAKELFRKCDNKPDFSPFYLAKIKLFEGNRNIIDRSLKRAVELNGSSERVALALLEYYMNNRFYKKAEELAKINVKRYPERSVFGLTYSKALLKLKKFDKCRRFLRYYRVLPYEGATEGRAVYHEACIRSAFKELGKKNFLKAIVYAKKGKLWPSNLGVGKSYDEDERLDDYIIAIAYEKLGFKKKSDEYYFKVINYNLPDYMKENSKLILQAIALKRFGKAETAKELIDAAVKNRMENRYVVWVKDLFASIERRTIFRKILNGKIGKTDSNDYVDFEFELVRDLLKITDKLR